MTAVNSVTTSSTTSTTGTTVSTSTLAGDFNTFLTLLTTQLKNQNPLDPLDTNQFTQELVMFAQVEQQMIGNDLLNTIALLQNAELATGALEFIGQTVVIAGNVTALENGAAKWSYSATAPATATFNVQDSTGKLVYTETRTVNPGTEEFLWNGKDTSGNTVPDGQYTLTITAKDTSGQTVAVSTEVQGVVEAVDLTQNPPVLTVDGATFTLDQVKRVVYAPPT
jgi:flagellar basal-body rod modification protein FlgD